MWYNKDVVRIKELPPAVGGEKISEQKCGNSRVIPLPGIWLRRILSRPQPAHGEIPALHGRWREFCALLYRTFIL